MRANFCETYGGRGARHVDNRYLDAGRLLPVGIVVKIGGYRQAEKRATVLSAQLTRDRMTARHVNAMCDTPALLHTDKKRLSGSGCPDGAFGVAQMPSGLIPSKFAKIFRCSNVPSLSILKARSRLPSVSATSSSCALVIANPFGCAILSATDRILPSGGRQKNSSRREAVRVQRHPR